MNTVVIVLPLATRCFTGFCSLINLSTSLTAFSCR